LVTTFRSKIIPPSSGYLPLVTNVIGVSLSDSLNPWMMMTLRLSGSQLP
jgi:precorrin-3B methylase